MIQTLLVIEGPPRTKKNHGRRVWARKQKRAVNVPSVAFELWEQKALWQLRQQWRQPAIDVPVRVCALFYRDKNVGDLVGYMQALADTLQKGRVIVDDKLIVSWDGTRPMKDAGRPRVEVVITTEVAA